jgi:tetratricopeptide (TPR) repeat protein
MAKLFLAAILAFASAADAATVKSWLRNREGLNKFSEKNYYQAYQSFLKALEEDPLDPDLQMNLGRTFEANEEYDKAEAAYKGALKILPENSKRRFEALFNLGGVFGKEGKIDEALGSYQAALEMDPQSKDVKTNIELLWQGDGQGKGQGKDKNKQDKDEKDAQGGDEDKKQQPDQKEKKTKPFKSEELTADDVKKILDEIKNQEQSIRAQEYERNAKDAPRAKDW